MSGTDIAYAAPRALPTRPLKATASRYPPTLSLRDVRFSLRGTPLLCAYARATRCPVLTQRMADPNGVYDALRFSVSTADILFWNPDLATQVSASQGYPIREGQP
eukprot:3468187-Rhodomonas_salina.1